MYSDKFHFEEGLNYRIFHITKPITQSNSDIAIIPYPCLIYCSEGSAKINYNNNTYTIHKDSVLCVFSNTTFQATDISDDLQSSVILFSNDLIIDSTIGFKAEYLSNIFAHPYKPLTDECNKQIFHNLFSTLDAYEDCKSRFDRSTDFVYGIIRCMLIALAEMSKHENKLNNISNSSFSTTDNYFRDFLKLLSDNCKTQHNVAFYADKLCITPKYLNEICRKKMKKTAKEVITRAVIAQIKNALIVSGTSVQRIAYDFNFCDQSSFGKYFKKATGLAPMAFRNKHNDSPES